MAHIWTKALTFENAYLLLECLHLHLEGHSLVEIRESQYILTLLCKFIKALTFQNSCHASCTGAALSRMSKRTNSRQSRASCSV